MYIWFETLLDKTLLDFGLSAGYVELVRSSITIVLMGLVCWLSDYVAKKILLAMVAQFAKKSKTVLDDILVEKKFFHRLAQLAPVFVIFALAPVTFYKYPVTIYWIQTVMQTIMVLVGARVIDALLNSFHAMYELLPDSKQKPIKGFIQIFKIIVYFIASLWMLSILFNKSLVYFFSGLGALAAVLMLVFKDSIMGLVAGVQLSTNNMLKPGDWITFSKYGADGNVVEISLHTVKVQNFDKTIVTIPTYSLIADSFQNWRGMEESDGRRFRRSMILDVRSVRFCDKELVEKLFKIECTQAFLKQAPEIGESVSPLKPGLLMNTNLGVFRSYVEYVLRNASQVNQSMPFIVKHGQMNENGLVIEIFSFTKDKAANPYEQFQAELMEHLLAIVPFFDLVIYQLPTGFDVKQIK